MSYATLDDLISRFDESEILQLTDVDRSGTPDADKFGDAQADADAEIDAALASRYKTPMSPIPRLLVRIACDLMRESLYTSAMPDLVKDRAAIARRLLASISRGDTRLDAAEAVANSGATKSDAKISHRRRRMRWPGDHGSGLC